MTEPRIALVTGAAKGIGLETARQLAQRDCIVWIGARDRERGENAAEALRGQGANVRFLQLDVTDDDSVRNAVNLVEATSGRLDSLINNAGVALDQGEPPSTLDVGRLRATFEVNVFGPVRVTQAFLPLLRRSPAGRIVMVSSGLGSLTCQTDPNFAFFQLNLMGYNSSKTALNAITIAFAKELADTPIKVNASNPGFTATDLNGHRGTQSAAEGARIQVELAMLPPDGPTGGFFGNRGPELW